LLTHAKKIENGTFEIEYTKDVKKRSFSKINAPEKPKPEKPKAEKSKTGKFQQMELKL
jgi:hypothetical protein